MVRYQEPTRGASLLLAFRPASRPVLIVGSGTLAATRIFTALDADATVLVAARGGLRKANEEVMWRVYHGDAEWLEAEDAVADNQDDRRPEEQQTQFRALLDAHPQIQLVCITDTLNASGSVPRRSAASAKILAQVCRERRVPVTVADMPALCDFTFPATHRFALSTEAADPSLRTVDVRGSDLQLAITANGHGCRLASRLKRELVARLPRNIGDAVRNVGRLRMLAKSEDEDPEALESSIAMRDSGVDIRPRVSMMEMEEDDAVPLNKPVRQMVDIDETPAERTARRMRWVAQLSEYTPLEQLAAMDERSMRQVLASRSPPPGKPSETGSKCSRSCSRPPPESAPESVPTHHALSLVQPTKPSGRIILVGSGPGHPGLLTRAAHHALTQLASLVLADKLVPAEIMAMIPKGVEVKVARKYPGNAEHAQDELITLAIRGAEAGQCVVRLKQGDPFLYGRGGEEVLAFRKAGFEPTVIPGISSAFSAPLLAGIPVTQRGVADSVVVCTAVGKGGRGGVLVGYERGRSVAILMGVARLGEVVRALAKGSSLGAVPEGVKGAVAAPTSTLVTLTANTTLTAATNTASSGPTTASSTSNVTSLGSTSTTVTPTPSTLSASKPATLNTISSALPTVLSGLTSPTTPHTPISTPLALSGSVYPSYTPIAIIERASSPDQRLVASTLDKIEHALERSGGQRPPGMILVGWAVLALAGPGELTVLDDAEGESAKTDLERRDRARVERWLNGEEYIVREGLAQGWEVFNSLGAGALVV